MENKCPGVLMHPCNFPGKWKCSGQEGVFCDVCKKMIEIFFPDG